MLLLALFQKQVVDFSRVLSFMIVHVIVNFRLVTVKFLVKEKEQSIGLKILSFDGIIFLTGFVVYFLVTIF